MLPMTPQGEFDYLKETVLITLEEMERAAERATDYQTMSEIRTVISILIRLRILSIPSRY